MAAPYSLMTRSNAPSVRGTCSPEARTKGNDNPNSAWNWCAIASWAGRRVDADWEGPTPGKPCGHVCRAASEFQRDPATEIAREETNGLFRHPEYPPGGLSR
jgi:hypothetical protein